MNEYVIEKDSVNFSGEVKDLLKGTISDDDVINYIAIKIARLHEKHLNDIFEKMKEGK